MHHAQRTGALTMQGGYLTIRPEAIPDLQLPSDISDTIAARIDTLPTECHRVLTFAALIGDVIPADHLPLLVQDTIVEAAIELAIQHDILRQTDETYQFTHSLIRQALAARLNLSQRQQRHFDIATALDRHYAENQRAHAIEIATHLLNADGLVDHPTLFSYTREAGNQAYGRFAWRDAARFFEAAIRASDFASVRAPLHQLAGLAHCRNQDAGPALRQFEQAMAYYKAVGDTPGLARSLIWLVRIRLTQDAVPMGTFPPYAEELEATLEALDASEFRLRGHIMTVLSQTYRYARHPQRAMAFAEAALSVGKRINDDRLCAQAGESCGLSYMSSLQVEHAIAHWKNALRFAQVADDIMLQMFALSSLPLAFNLQGSLEEGEEAAREGIVITRTLQDWSQYSKALSHLASIAAARGHFQEVEQHTRDTMIQVARSGYPWGGFRALGAMAGSCAVRGLWEDAHQALDTMSTPGQCFTTPGRIVEVFARVFRQVMLGYEGKYLTEKVIPLCDALMEVATTDTYSLAPLCAMIELGEMTLMPEVVERPAILLKEAWDRGVVFTSGWCFLIPRSLGLAAIIMGEWEEAEAYFNQALTIATYANALPELGRTYLDIANMVGHSPDVEDLTPLADLLRQARRILLEQGMLPHARHAGDYLEHLFPEEPPPDDIDSRRNGSQPPTPPDDEPFTNDE